MYFRECKLLTAIGTRHTKLSAVVIPYYIVNFVAEFRDILRVAVYVRTILISTYVIERNVS